MATKRTHRSQEKNQTSNRFDYTPVNSNVTGTTVIRLVGLPGYLTTGFAWLSITGFVCSLLLIKLMPASSNTETHSESSPLTALLSDKYTSGTELVAQIFSYALALIVVILGLVATVYFFRALAKYCALFINRVASVIGSSDRIYFYKIELGLLGWTLLALIMIFTGELLWVATLTAACASSLVSISFVGEHRLLKKRSLSESDIWR